jgi:hypothetical protein
MLAALVRPGALAALAGGTAWIVKFAIITTRDGHFQPVEAVVYIGGLVAILIGVVGLASAVAARFRAWVRPVSFLVVFVVALAISFFLLETVQGLADGTGNEGLDEELGVLAVGVLWVAVGSGLYARARARRRTSSTI